MKRIIECKAQIIGGISQKGKEYANIYIVYPNGRKSQISPFDLKNGNELLNSLLTYLELYGEDVTE